MPSVWFDVHRLMGQSAFRQQMLARHGSLVVLDDDKCQGSTNSSLAYIIERLDQVMV